MDTNEKVRSEMVAAERKAWNALARYKFWMFGYHAAQWVLLNRLLPARQRNPFAWVVRLAKVHLEHGDIPDMTADDDEEWHDSPF